MSSAFPSSSSSGWLAGDQLPRNMLLECLAWTAGGHSRLVLQEDIYEIRHLAITRPAKTLGTKWVTDLFGSLWREHTQASRLSPLKCFFSRTQWMDMVDDCGKHPSLEFFLAWNPAMNPWWVCSMKNGRKDSGWWNFKSTILINKVSFKSEVFRSQETVLLEDWSLGVSLSLVSQRLSSEFSPACQTPHVFEAVVSGDEPMDWCKQKTWHRGLFVGRWTFRVGTL